MLPETKWSCVFVELRSATSHAIGYFEGQQIRGDVTSEAEETDNHSSKWTAGYCMC